MRPRADGQREEVREEAEEEEEELFDPWAPLDPNDPGPWPQKPYRKMAKPLARKPRKASRKSGLQFGLFSQASNNPDNLAFEEFAYALPSKGQARRAPGPRGRSLDTVFAGTGTLSAPLQTAFTSNEAGLAAQHAEEFDDYPGRACTSYF